MPRVTAGSRITSVQDRSRSSGSRPVARRHSSSRRIPVRSLLERDHSSSRGEVSSSPRRPNNDRSWEVATPINLHPSQLPHLGGLRERDGRLGTEPHQKTHRKELPSLLTNGLPLHLSPWAAANFCYRHTVLCILPLPEAKHHTSFICFVLSMLYNTTSAQLYFQSNAIPCVFTYLALLYC